MTLADGATSRETEFEDTETVDPDVEQFEDTETAELSEDERADLESRVSDRLDKLGRSVTQEDLDEHDIVSDEDSGEDDEDAPDEDDELDEEDAPDEDDGLDEGEGGEEDTADQEAAAETPAPTLPDSYRRSLKARGWTDAEIDESFEAIGPKFLDTAAKIHEGRNAEVAGWAQLGRQTREQEKSGESGQQSRESGQPPTGLSPIDTAKLKEEYGDDELIDAIVGPVNKAIARVNEMLPQLEQGTQRVEQVTQQAHQAEQDQLVRSVEAFFGSDDLKPYAEVYGDGSETVTEDQWANRNRVLELADAIHAGALMQGRRLGLEEALQTAHDHIASEFRDRVVRNTIRKEAKKRNRGITQKPSSRGKSTRESADKGPVTRSKLEQRVAQRLASLGR